MQVREFTCDKEVMRKQVSFVTIIKRLQKGSPEYIEYIIKHAGCITLGLLKYNGEWFDFNYFLCDEYYDRLAKNTNMGVLAAMIYSHALTLLDDADELY